MGATTLLERIDWTALDAEVSHQQRNREVHTPVISLFRWWARRPHALIGGILDAAGPDSLVVSDPFSGGGTVALEAARRGHDVYAQDLHPWAVTGLATALDRVDPEELERGGKDWLKILDSVRREHYGSDCPSHAEDSEILSTFWVRQTSCPGCQSPVFLFPYSLLTIASRSKSEDEGFFGCDACGSITRSSLTAKDRRCSSCRRSLSHPNKPRLAGSVFTCPSGCGHSSPVFEPNGEWRPVLVQRFCGGSSHFDRPTDDEISAAFCQPPEAPAALTAAIPAGIETRRLQRAGIERWSDLYPDRQLTVMLSAAEALSSLDVSPEVRTRLRLILAGSGEMAGFSSRWDRYHPKSFEAIANHRFNLTPFSVETNLLADRGRGTLPRRLRHSVQAARWAQEFEGQPPSRLSSRRRPTEAHSPDGVTIVRGSSVTQHLGDCSVDLVLTDPPYFDDVQYAELGSLFLAWAQAVGLVGSSVSLDFRSEVVVNGQRHAGVEKYCARLTAVLTETARTLKPEGRVILTFHNSAGQAWWALARALGKAGLCVSSLAVAHAENESDHAKRGRRAFSHDLVIESTQLITDPRELHVATKGDGAQAEELLAVGRAVAQLAFELASGQVRRTRSYDSFGKSYRERLEGRQSTYIRLGRA